METVNRAGTIFLKPLTISEGLFGWYAETWHYYTPARFMQIRHMDERAPETVWIW